MEHNITLTELKKIIVGEICVIALIFLGFLLLDQLSLSVVLGAFYGAVLNILYFLMICLSVNHIFHTSDSTDTKKTKSSIRFSYFGRLLMLGIGLGIGLKSAYFHNIALLIPVLMTRPIIMFTELLRKEVR